jgi:hypothetical protein
MEQNKMTTEQIQQRADKMFGLLNDQHDKPLGRLIDGRRRSSGIVDGGNWTGGPLQWSIRELGQKENFGFMDMKIHGGHKFGELVGELRIQTETETCHTIHGDKYQQTTATVFLDRGHFLDALLTDQRGAKPGWCVVHYGEDGSDVPVWDTHNKSLITAILDGYCGLVG